MTHLEPNDLLLFARVVEEGSFSRAAEKLGIPVSTASRRITELERQLGERLILRTTRKLTVTELGLAVAEHARQVLQSAQAAAELADYRQLKPSGRLRISVPTELPLLAPFIAEFLASNPAVTMEIDVSMRAVDLIGDNFDLALRLRHVREDATLSARPVLKLTGGLYAAPTYIKSFGTPKEPDELKEHRTLHPLTASGEPLRWILQRGSARWEGLPPGRAAVNSPAFMVRLAIHGAGIAILEDSHALSYISSGQLVRVLPDWEYPPATLWVVFPGRRLMAARTRAFIDALMAKFGSGAERS